jgi:trk system potassium uptake protein TrkA
MGKKHAGRFAVVGLGRFGESLLLALLNQGCETLGIDRDAALAHRLADKTDCVVLDATDEDALREIDIATYDAVVVAIADNFESNVMSTVALKSVGVRRVVSVCGAGYERDILQQVGADRVLEPRADSGRRLARELLLSGTEEQAQLGRTHTVVTLPVPAAREGEALAALMSRNGGDQVTLLALQREGERPLICPPGDMPVRAGDLLLLLGTNEAVAAFCAAR